MKNLFPGYYRPTQEEFSKLWGECLFVLDTNVLLNLYRYSPTTRDELTAILRDLSERLWVPWQVALEYQRNRLDVVNRQLTVRSQIAKNLESAQDDAIKKVKRALSPSPVHPFLSESDLVQKIEAFFSQLINDVKDSGQDHDALLAHDHLRESLSSLLRGRIGPSYSCERLEEIYSEGKKRYERRIPPGYADAEQKDDAKRYGDLIIWFQMIDHAQRVKKPVVFVTDDSKEDWWRKEHEKIIGPRPELVEEMLSKAGVRFYMYRAPRFIEKAPEYLERQASQQAIDEARRVAEQESARSRAANERLAALPIWGRAWLEEMYSSIARVDDIQRQQQAAYRAAFEAAVFPKIQETVQATQELLRRGAEPASEAAYRVAGELLRRGAEAASEAAYRAAGVILRSGAEAASEAAYRTAPEYIRRWVEAALEAPGQGGPPYLGGPHSGVTKPDDRNAGGDDATRKEGDADDNRETGPTPSEDLGDD